MSADAPEDETRPAKRARPEDDGEARTAPKRSEEFWLDDGNIILIAQDTAFRVYRQLLASQSKVFADMLAASRADTNDTIEDCPVVRLSDSPQDLTHLLRVLLPREHRILYRDTEHLRLRLDHVAAVIHLAHKYEIEDLLRQALSALKADLATFERCTEGPSSRLAVKYSAAQDEKSNLLHQRIPEAICIVNLARFTDTPSLLPVGLYLCSSLGDRLFDGWKHEDGTVEYLSGDDIRLCFKAQLPLARRGMKVLDKIFSGGTSDECPHPDVCQKILRRCFGDAARDIQDAVSLNPLLDPRYCYRFHSEDLLDCEKCSELCVERELDLRRDTWLWLPKLFELQLEGWGQGIV
ncbi:hypothetical protein C8Q80DRAFT_1108867 [Daedaleopsis nitida]|nr:hypothetical protein C8Q80DRAFT_1108867 [Daedaleopsis nitida]